MKIRVFFLIIILIIALTEPTFDDLPVEPLPEENRTEMKICRRLVTRFTCTKTEELNIYSDSSFKSFMDGFMITNSSSEQFRQLSKMTVDKDGVYSEGPYKGIAMASYYGHVGDKFRISLSSGQKFLAVMTDVKQDCHVGSDYADLINGSLIEFICATDLLDDQAWLTGSLDYIYEGRIVKIERIINEPGNTNRTPNQGS